MIVRCANRFIQRGKVTQNTLHSQHGKFCRQFSAVSSNATIKYSKMNEEQRVDHFVKYYEENRQLDILMEWEAARKSNKRILLTEQVTEIIVLSSMEQSQRKVLVSVLDSAKDQHICIKNEAAYTSYFIACSESSDRNWRKAVSMLDFITSTGVSHHLLQSCFEKTLEICQMEKKWKTALEVLKKMHSQPFGISQKALVCTLLVCCAQEDIKAAKAASTLFAYMIQHNLPRNEEVYFSLFRCFESTKVSHEFDEAWREFLNEKAINVSTGVLDQLYAMRLSSLCQSALHLDDALTLFESVCTVIDKPVFSLKSLILGLVSAGQFQVAKDVMNSVDHLKIQLPASLLSSYVKELCIRGRYLEAGNFLVATYEEQYGDNRSTSVLSPFSRTKVQYWQHTLEGLLADHDHEVSPKLLERLMRMQNNKFLTPAEQIEAGDAVSAVLPGAIEEFAKQKQWLKAVALVEEQRNIFEVDTAITMYLLRMLVDCDEISIAVETMLKSLRSFAWSSLSLTYDSQPSAAGVKVLQLVFVLVHALAKRDKWDEIRHFIANLHSLVSRNEEGPSEASTTSQQRFSHEINQSINELLPQLCASSSRLSFKSLGGTSHPVEVLKLQRSLEIVPTWPSVRMALASAFAQCKWIECLQIFNARKLCTGYIPGDEVIFNWSIRAAGAISEWTRAVDILALLLSEKDSPGPYPLESIIEILLRHKQAQFVIEIFNLMSDRGVPRSVKMMSLIKSAKGIPENLREQLVFRLMLLPLLQRGPPSTPKQDESLNEKKKL